jgi:hypothetical protein
MIRPATLAAVVVLLACSDRRRNDAMDSSLSRDLQLASQIAAQPTFQDTALAPVAEAPAGAAEQPRRAPQTQRERPVVRAPEAPVVVAERPRAQTPEPSPTPEPAPSPAPAAAPSRSIGAGVGMSMTAGGRICSTTNRPGDKIVAIIDAPVSGSNGAYIPAGSKAVLEVVSASTADSPEQSRIVFRVRALYVGDASYQVAGDVTPTSELERSKVAGNPGSDKKKVIGGAIAGAIIGQMLGHDTKSTVIGAATGAAAGTAMAKSGERYEGCMREGATLRLTLAEPIAM